jgi:hypothetical protein
VRPYPVATPSCSKVLVVNDFWPARCEPARPPDCPAYYCYANRSGSGYDVVEAPHRA